MTKAPVPIHAPMLFNKLQAFTFVGWPENWALWPCTPVVGLAWKWECITRRRKTYLLYNMVVYLWCYGSILLPLVMGPMLKVNGIMNFNQYSDSQKHCCLCYAASGSSRKTITKRTLKSTKKWFICHKINILKWPSQSRDLKPIENLQFELKRAVHKRRQRISRFWKDYVWRNGLRPLPMCSLISYIFLEKGSVLLAS